MKRIGKQIGRGITALVIGSVMASPAFAQTAPPTSTPRPDQAVPFSGVPVGAIVQYPGFIIPDGWLLCDGSEASREQYPDLFATYQTTYGGGDGVTTFGLPDCGGRTLVGTGTADSKVWRGLGESYGENYHVLTIEEMPMHRHGFPFYLLRRTPNSGSINLNGGDGANWWNPLTDWEGGDQPFSLAQPSLAVYFLIWSGTGVGAIGGGGMEQGTPVPEVMVYSTVDHGETTQPVGFAYTIDAGQIGIMILLFAIFVVLMLRVVTDLIGWRHAN